MGIGPDRGEVRESEELAVMVEAAPPPDPGSGATARRFDALTAVSRRSLVLGRLFEGHADAIAILHEAGTAVPDGLLGVWASEGGDEPVVLVHAGADRFAIDGTKHFCSASTQARWALVTAHAGLEAQLVLVDLRADGVAVSEPTWVGAGMRAADTRSVMFRNAPVAAVVGPPNWYLERVGFWHGAVGVAACWLGGAQALVDTLRRDASEHDPHAMAHLGEAAATVFAMEATLGRAAGQIDSMPRDGDAAYERALLVRGVVEAGCRSVLDQVALALGPRPLALDLEHSARVADLEVYLRQHHGRRDLAELGTLMKGKTDVDPRGSDTEGVEVSACGR